MSATIISGKELSSLIRERITKETEELSAQFGKRPGLAVIQVGENPASTIYVNNKKKACEQVGFQSFGYSLPESASEKELLDLIDQLNKDDRVHGILCQLPLPKHMDEFSVICAIAPEKDVDGFHPVNKGLLSIGRDCLVSCTPKGCIELLKYANVDISGKNCVVIGRSNIVGKPVASLMLHENATVTVVHSRTQNIKEICKQADILIVAIGKQGFVTKDFVKEGAVIIDVGINRCEDGKVRGDVDFDDVVDIASAITPVPGGVGPMTITMLLQNTLEAFTKIEKGNK
ncbi:MAG: bifunctional methylenetetrahydrofolate dehydrogenase/methenyltetrahydrofolate cyclohydrolase FolD [Clostridiales bacterium]|nr:bifunctional methylenetetrahydrofolate dehydrogenase/methenyltetrahydrofolate cyclohydrolase FolD [Clostridiales bacterium]